MPKGYRKSDLKEYTHSQYGIPQGLAISNILASIYLSDFDKTMNNQKGKYFRYIDDILIICRAHDRESIQKKMKSEIGGDCFGLKLHDEEKNFSGDSSIGFEYLGYYFKPDGLVSVSKSSIERYVEGIASKFTAYSKRRRYTIDRDKLLTKEERQSILIKELNLKITGAISEDRRYGWVFYYSEINDLSVLHRIDRCIDKFFKRNKDFPEGAPKTLKKIVRAFYESKYSPSSGYVHDYKRYKTVQKKRDYLISKGQISKKKEYTPKQIEAIFTDCMYRETSELESDERNIYPFS
ncbi:MAG: reverse transcriptase domain-containing protein [Bacteroidota bacterium]